MNNKKIALLGFGVTGREVYKCLDVEYDITIINDNPVDDFDTKTVEQVADIKFDIIIKSPGVPYSHPFLQGRDCVITNDIELAYEVIVDNMLDTKIIAITGTNGKTTTTQFISDVLASAGFKSYTCGNIGQSPLLILNQTLNVDYLVMELSSYQLKQVNKFHPNFGLFLNVSPDHIDYHGDFADYLNSKCNLFKNMTSNDCLVLDETMVAEHNEVKWPSFAIGGADESLLAEVTTVSMPKQNYRLIFNLLLKAGIASEFIINSLNNFAGLEHRLELVENDLGFRVINDSKATNVNATNVAISNLNGPTTLIVGGSIKVEDYTLLNYQDSNLKNIIAYGAAKDKFSFIPNVQMFDDFEQAVLFAVGKTSSGETLLLSPACASFDQHPNYGERGKQFKQIIKGTNE
ncbi:UDP-N-acetylmuramoyl-L-alanine--D-glutamate ligase [Mollicutes bacterium LVI A0078]|nr:UDP-N-acetylmuramoyl-L-alanine--D-glutamate ligase [Mollicutes bacterium LVI A0075]WOO90316.1 UDP-N-acetylmuramoyl-L-alanine--D-glutamate ligase [Mollicutes bacterium LVI A0078]